MIDMNTDICGKLIESLGIEVRREWLENLVERKFNLGVGFLGDTMLLIDADLKKAL